VGETKNGAARSRLVVLVAGALAVLVLGAGCGGGNDDPLAQPNPGELFPDRANQFREDQERAIGDPAMLSGYTTTVTDAFYKGDGIVTVEVRIENRDDEPQEVSSGDWQLVTPDDHVYDPERSTLPAFGEVAGEPVTGNVGFLVDELGVVGDFYIVYKPDGLDAARGIWSFTVEE
jgi:hypothetical protein